MSLRTQVVIHGTGKLLSRLDRMKSNWEKEQIKATEEAGDYILQQLPGYPSKPASSTYTRTGTLGKSLNRKARKRGSTVVGIIGSPIIYSPHVISSTPQSGRGPQTWFHRKNGWFTLQSEIKRLRSGIVKVYRAALKRAKG